MKAKKKEPTCTKLKICEQKDKAIKDFLYRHPTELKKKEFDRPPKSMFQLFLIG
jgi:hypothetical protein